MVTYAEPGTLEWIESGGGPLIAVPETVLPFWAGADGDETASDYDRACEVDAAVGLLPVGDGAALVLGDEPASTAYLPAHSAFVRWCAADSEGSSGPAHAGSSTRRTCSRPSADGWTATSVATSR